MQYNRLEAARYAQKWALSANPKFYHFGGIGGDCTNFVSQCLYAGGASMIYGENGWYYTSVNSRSPSWTSVTALGEFLLRKKSKGVVGRVVEIGQIQIGDVIQLRQNESYFNHTVIVSKIVDGKIYVCSHSYDALDKPLESYFYFEARFIHILEV